MGILLFFKTIFGFVSSWLSTLWKFIVQNPKMAVVIVCLAGALFGGLKIKHSFDTLKSENTALIANVDHLKQETAQLRIDVKTAVDVNVANQKVIDSLSIAAVDSQQQVADLKKSQVISVNKINVIRQVIAESKPQDDGPVANVLKETLKSIQADREATNE